MEQGDVTKDEYLLEYGAQFLRIPFDILISSSIYTKTECVEKPVICKYTESVSIRWQGTSNR